MDTIHLAVVWLTAHQAQILQFLLLAWAVANVVWAQWPKPKSERAQRIWKIVHNVLQLVVTHSQVPGTFTWPSVVRGVVESMTNKPAPDPFGPKGDGNA